MWFSKKRFLFFSLLALLLAPAIDAQAQAAKVRPLFDIPTARKKSNYVLRDEVIRLIKASPAHSKIRASFYHANSLEVAKALAAAAKRGVDVGVVLDDSWQLPENLGFAKILESGLSSSSLIKCKNRGCMAHKGNNHNKFYTFSETRSPDGKKVKNVSVQTSSNMSADQFYKYQDMLVFENDPLLYQHYFNYWEDLAAQRENLDYMRSKTGSTYSADSHARLFSSSTQGPDPVLSKLNDLRCIPGDRIDVLQSNYKSDRGLPIMTRLAQLKSQGCEVNVILRSTTKATDLKQIQDLKLNLYLVDGSKMINVHSKILIANAMVVGNNGKLVPVHYVFAGSMNMTLGSLRSNDDTFARISSKVIYKQYLNYVQTILKHIRANAK